MKDGSTRASTPPVMAVVAMREHDATVQVLGETTTVSATDRDALEQEVFVALLRVARQTGGRVLVRIDDEEPFVLLEGGEVVPAQEAAAAPPDSLPVAASRDLSDVPTDHRPEAPPESSADHGTRRRVWIALGSAATVIVVVAGAGAVLALPRVSGGESPEQSDPAAVSSTQEPRTYIPALAPPGYGTEAVWSTELADGTAPVITSSGYVASARPSGRGVEIVDPGTGDVLHESASLHGGIVPVTSPTEGFAWLSGAGELRVWDVERREVVDVSGVPPGAILYGAGGAVMLWAEGSTSVGTYDGSDSVTTVTIPDGTTPLGVDEHGAVVSSAGALPLWSTATRDAAPPAPLPLEAPDGAQVRRWIGMTNSRVVIAWTTGKPDTVAVRVHDTTTGLTTAEAEVPWPVVEEADLVTSQDGDVAVGPLFLPREGPPLVAVDQAVSAISLAAGRFALRNGVVGTVAEDGSWTALPTGTAIPLATGPDNQAIVRAGGRAYALPLEAN